MAARLGDRFLAVLAIFIGLAAFALLLRLSRPSNFAPDLEALAVAPQEGALAPGFALTNLEGATIELAGLRGRPVLINFWATWCEPCKLEMPFIEARYQRYRDRGFTVLAVDFNEPAEAVAAFRDEVGVTFEMLLDPGGQVQRLYQVRGYPSSYFVDREGVIRGLQIGVMTEGQLDEHLAEIGLSG